MLPMLQLSSGTPNSTHQIPGGTWLVRKPGPYGKSFRPHSTGQRNLLISPIAVRHKAVDFSNQSRAVVSYLPGSTLYKGIVKKADLGAINQCQYGPEILVYIHDGKHPGLATLYGGSKTTRTEYARYLMSEKLVLPPDFFSVLQLDASRGIRGTLEWWSPRITVTQFFWRPDESNPVTSEQIRGFLNPPTHTVELPTRLQDTFDKVMDAVKDLSEDDRHALLQVLQDD